MARDMSREEVYETLKKYDPEAYEYYKKNAWYFGMGARRYAEYLIEHERRASKCSTRS